MATGIAGARLAGRTPPFSAAHRAAAKADAAARMVAIRIHCQRWYVTGEPWSRPGGLAELPGRTR